MKRVLTLSVIVLLAMAFNMKAQTLKLGHVDSQKILANLPASKKAQEALEAEAKSIQEQIEVMEVEYNNKVNDYLTNKKLPATDPKKWSDLVIADKEKEIQGLQVRMQEFQQTAQKQMAEKKNELLNPILENIKKAIAEVGKENKFYYIFDVQFLLYHSPETIDVTDMVKAKVISM